MTQYAPIISLNNGHRPMLASDQLVPANIPVSARAANQIQVLTDGLYAGPTTALQTIYVNSAGTDDVAHGAKATPVKTLTYALTLAAATTVFPGTTVTVAMQAGQTFTLASRITVGNSLSTIRLAFYGDPVYGDFDGALIGGVMVPAMMATLQRPIVTLSSFQDTTGLWISAGINGKVVTEGVTFNLPTRPSIVPPDGAYGVNDFVSASGESCSLVMRGTIVNRTDVASYSGIIGTKSRSTSLFNVFGCQFQLAGQLANATNALPPATLVGRGHFMHFYADSSGVDTTKVFMFAASATSSNSSGIMTLNWSDTVGGAIGSSGQTLSTFPQLSDVTYGTGLYFTGLRRDQQSRPLNVNSGRLF